MLQKGANRRNSACTEHCFVSCKQKQTIAANKQSIVHERGSWSNTWVACTHRSHQWNWCCAANEVLTSVAYNYNCLPVPFLLEWENLAFACVCAAFCCRYLHANFLIAIECYLCSYTRFFACQCVSVFSFTCIFTFSFCWLLDLLLHPNYNYIIYSNSCICVCISCSEDKLDCTPDLVSKSISSRTHSQTWSQSSTRTRTRTLHRRQNGISSGKNSARCWCNEHKMALRLRKQTDIPRSHSTMHTVNTHTNNA